MSEQPTSLEAALRLVDQLRDALETRDVIGQAKGILMAAEAISADDAFLILVRASQRQNRKLRDIAADVVESTVGRRLADAGGR